MNAQDRAATESGMTSRRALFAGAGAIGVSAALVACGGDDGKASAGDASGGGAPAGGAGPAAPRGGGSANEPLARTGDIPVGGGKIFPQGVVITQPTAGQFRGFSATCTHQGCPVGSVADGTINCSCHGSRFSIEDGSVRRGPAIRALAAKRVRIDGDEISLG